VFGLRWCSINWELGLVCTSENVIEGRWGTPKGQKQERIFPLPDWVLARLRRLRERAGDPDIQQPIFATEVGTPLRPQNVLRRQLRPVCEKLGFAWRGFHAFRRGVATENILDAGVDPKTLQQWLGHSNITTTLDHYAIANALKLRGVVTAWAENGAGDRATTT
jgi:integrase